MRGEAQRLHLRLWYAEDRQNPRHSSNYDFANPLRKMIICQTSNVRECRIGFSNRGLGTCQIENIHGRRRARQASRLKIYTCGLVFNHEALQKVTSITEYSSVSLSVSNLDPNGIHKMPPLYKFLNADGDHIRPTHLASSPLCSPLCRPSRRPFPWLQPYFHPLQDYLPHYSFPPWHSALVRYLHEL